MARKITISKEMILDTALQILIQDGYDTVNIKTIAAALNCSTQPIVWHFENMEGLRMALADYAVEYAKEKASSPKSTANNAFASLGEAYIQMALKEPNLFQYLYLGGSPKGKQYSTNNMLSGKGNDEMIEGFAKELNLSREQAFSCIRDTIIYAHGLATMVATGVFKATKKELLDLLNDAADGFVEREITKIDPK